MGSKQLGFGDYEQSTAKRRTRRERFLAEMESVVPWVALIELIEPHYPRTSSKGADRPTRWRRRCGSICCSSGTT
jgi:IS5 family transposase